MTQSQRNGGVQKGAEGRGRTKGVKPETCHLISGGSVTYPVEVLLKAGLRELSGWLGGCKGGDFIQKKDALQH